MLVPASSLTMFYNLCLYLRGITEKDHLSTIAANEMHGDVPKSKEGEKKLLAASKAQIGYNYDECGVESQQSTSTLFGHSELRDDSEDGGRQILFNKIY